MEKLTVDLESPKLVVVELPSGNGEEGFAKQGSGGGGIVCICVRGRRAVRVCGSGWRRGADVL